MTKGADRINITPQSTPRTSQVFLSGSGSLPDIPMHHSPPATWRSSRSGCRSHSCSCRPSHHTWNLEVKGRGQDRAACPSPTPPPHRATSARAAHPCRGDHSELRKEEHGTQAPACHLPPSTLRPAQPGPSEGPQQTAAGTVLRVSADPFLGAWGLPAAWGQVTPAGQELAG